MTINKLTCKLQHLLPQHLLSRMIAKLANCQIKSIKNALITLFINAYKIELSEAVSDNLDDYPTFNHFFTRGLKPSARPVAKEKDSLVSPVDGVISQVGTISGTQLFQAKGHHFCLTELLGGDQKVSDHYQHGHYLTAYLAPKDYHRVHMPMAGRLLKTVYVPGKLFSVNHQSVTHVANLFCQNERLICLFETVAGEMALIMVGAMLVAGIRTIWGGREVPSTATEVFVKYYDTQGVTLTKGAEVGRFEFGSTVILLFQPGAVEWLAISPQQTIKMGQPIGRILGAHQP